MLGETLEAAQRGAARVRVEYEPLPAILTIDEAIAAESFHCRSAAASQRGDAAAHRRSALRIDGELRIGGQEHFYLETQCRDRVARRNRRHRAALLHAASQRDAGGRRARARRAAPSGHRGVPAHGRRVRRQGSAGESVGGHRGARRVEDEAPGARAPAARARHGAHRQAPSVPRALSTPASTTTAACSASPRRSTRDGGWSLDLSEPVLWRALFHVDNAYYLPAVDVTGYVCRTHKTSQTAFRGFGGPQGMLVIEEMLDRIARTLGIAAEVVRERNFYREGDTTHYGQPVKDAARIATHLDAAAARPAISPRAAPRSRRSTPRIRTRKRGLAITPVKFGISFTATFFNQAGALVLVYRDGSVQVNHGGTEMGQGLHTKIRQIAADEPGRAARRHPHHADAHRQGAEHVGDRRLGRHRPERRRRGRCVPRSSCAAAPSPPRCSAARRCGSLRRRPSPAANVDRLRAVVEAPTAQRMPLFAQGYYRTPGIHFDPKTGQRQAVPLFRLRRRRHRSGDRRLHRRASRAARRHPAGRRRFARRR